MKNPWPIALTTLIVCAFSASTWVAVTMIRQKVDLVIPDYYEQDLRHSERMAQEIRARELAQPLAVRPNFQDRHITLDFPDPSAEGTIQLYRPSDSSMDQSLAIEADKHGQQLVSLSGLASGLWRINVAWRQSGEDYYHSEPLVIP
ncbi:MAG TPA: FixH family protein [Kiritimatiellia bacterium]|nr:FixH family protein [Kiritimatiellia bacterium]